MNPVIALFGIDVGDLVADLLRALLDLLVPDFAAKWGSQLASWLVALPNVSDGRQFRQLNAFRVDLTHAAWGLLSLSFAVGALQYWAAGFAEASRASAFDAFRRAVVAAAALAVYPTLIAQLVLAVNHLTAAVILHPRVSNGLDLVLGGALALGVMSGGLTLGLGLAAVVAALFFVAALMVMKIALTAMLCVLAVSGALVIALYPMPIGDGLARLWLSGLVCAVAVPVAWALIFAVAGLVSADALAWSGGLGEGLAALVKPFVAVACLYLAYRAPALMVAQARMLGLRLDIAGGHGMRGSPGESRLRSVGQRQGGAYRDRFAGLGAAAARPAAAGAARFGGAAMRQTGAVGRTVRRAAASGAVNLAAAAGENGRRGERVVAGVAAATGAARATGRAGRSAGRAVRYGADWWRQPGAGTPGRVDGRGAAQSTARGHAAPRARSSRPSASSPGRHSHGGDNGAGPDRNGGLSSRHVVVRRATSGTATRPAPAPSGPGPQQPAPVTPRVARPSNPADSAGRGDDRRPPA